MLSSVPVSPKCIEEYRPIIGHQRTDEIVRLARPLRGARVAHVNATAFGGGVAEILSTLVPLMNDLGLAADWQVIRGADEFFQVTKAMHNALQGMPVPWTARMQDLWLRYNAMNAAIFDGEYDFVVVHDPQPAGLLNLAADRRGGRPGGKWIWRCHLDMTDAQAGVWDFLRPHLEPYDAAIFTLRDYVKEDLRVPSVEVIPPAIDPLSPKNVAPSPETIAEVLRRYGVDGKRPLICQVSRFDPWKDPLGVVDAYRIVKRQIPELQLVMVASMASDDPEGWSYFERTARRAGEDFDVHLLSNLNGVGNLEVGAFQRASAVVVQKSIREGFGLVVSEALWKGRPVVAGNCGGIPLQVVEGRTGYLVSTVQECADRVLFLLQHPRVADHLGRRGHEHVREHYLITRYLRDHLALLGRLAGAHQSTQVCQTAAAGRAA
ncbi:MAG: glycosyltransferase [Chloroflexi bacterium]|nr:glycosyltransferase [Chloroflexota bacterium]